MQEKSLIILCMSLVGLQVGIFICILLFASCRISNAIQSSNKFMAIFYSLTFLYSMCELSIQVYQLVTIIIYQKPQDNASTVLAINIFCIIFDLHILLMLNLYWKTIQGSFVETLDSIQQNTTSSITFKMVPTLCWFLCYTVYFVYLCISRHLTIDNFGISQHHVDSIILYIVCQAISGLLLLMCVLWQAYGWIKLDKTIQNFRRIVPLDMNTNRIKAIFWGTAVFNLFRTLFISMLIVWAYHENYENLIIGLNAFTFTSIVPIIFYLFGFKIESSSTKQNLINDRSSKSSRKTSSAHQTQLSHKSQRQQIH